MAKQFLNYRMNREEITFIDKAMLVVAIVHPLSALPQVFDIYSNQSAENVSLVTWVSFMLIGIIYTIYAVIHRLKPMIISQILWYAVDLSIIIGILMYG